MMITYRIAQVEAVDRQKKRKAEGPRSRKDGLQRNMALAVENRILQTRTLGHFAFSEKL